MSYNTFALTVGYVIGSIGIVLRIFIERVLFYRYVNKIHGSLSEIMFLLVILSDKEVFSRKVFKYKTNYARVR